jgi:rare lipoprotein A
MMGSNMFKTSVMARAACAAVSFAVAASVQAGSNPPPQSAAQADAPHASQATRHSKPKLDLSGRTRIGKASFYSAKFNGRKMADGSRMDPQADSAASKTLPLGTTAKVTNLETGESTVVTIRDRGPHVRGRIVDLSPASARQVGIDRDEGVSKVAVTPLSLPPTAADARTPGAVPDRKPVKRPHESGSTPR